MGELRVEYPDVNNLFPIFANELFLESVSWDKKTGEWIVYHKVDDCLKFLCLYIHDSDDTNDEKLFSLIEDEIQ